VVPQRRAKAAEALRTEVRTSLVRGRLRDSARDALVERWLARGAKREAIERIIEEIVRQAALPPAEADVYAILGVAPDAPQEDLQVAFRDKYRWARSMGDKRKAGAHYAALEKAWKRVKTPERRAAYDEERAAAPPPGEPEGNVEGSPDMLVEEGPEDTSHEDELLSVIEELGAAPSIVPDHEAGLTVAALPRGAGASGEVEAPNIGRPAPAPAPPPPLSHNPMAWLVGMAVLVLLGAGLALWPRGPATLVVDINVAAEVVVDGKVVGQGTRVGPIVLPSEVAHTILVQAPGHRPISRTLSLTEGVEKILSLELLAAERPVDFTEGRGK